MVWPKFIMVVWLTVFIAATSCLPILELNDLRTYSNIKNEYYEQDKEEIGDISELFVAPQGTKYAVEQMKKKDRLSELMDIILRHRDTEYDDGPNIYEDDESAVADRMKLIKFRNIMDGILEEIGPFDREIDREFEKSNDYDSIIFDLLQGFIGEENSDRHGVDGAEEYGLLFNDKLQSIFLHKSHAAEMDREFLTSLIKFGNTNKWHIPRKSGYKNHNQKKRSKRLSAEDGFVKEQPILNIDLDTTIYKLRLKEMYRKKGAICMMIRGYRQRPIMAIATCPMIMAQSNIRKYCEQSFTSKRIIEEQNIIDLLHTPVQDDNGFVYKNLYCAQCNGVTDPNAWETKVDCEDMKPLEFSDGRDKVMIMGEYSNKNSDCTKRLRPPKFEYEQMIYECEPADVQEIAGIRRHQTRIGNGGDDDYSPLPLSFSIFMNFGFDGKTHILFTTSKDQQPVSQVCPNDQTYDPVNYKCRNVSCDEGYKLVEKNCVRTTSYESDTPTNDITSLKYIEETVQVILTLKNVSWGEIVLLNIESVEAYLVMDLARRFNISLDRIANLTVSVVNASSSSNSSDIEMIEIHRFTTPKPSRPLNKEDSAWGTANLRTTKSTTTTSEDKNNTLRNNITSAPQKYLESSDDPGLNGNISMSIKIHVTDTNVSVSADRRVSASRQSQSNLKNSKLDNNPGATTQYSSNKLVASLKEPQSEEPNLNEIDFLNGYPNLNVRVSFLLKPAHENRTLIEKSVKSVVKSMNELISRNSFSITINGTSLKVESLENPINPTPMDEFCKRGENAYISEDEFEVVRRYDGDENENVTFVKINSTGQEFKPGEYDLTYLVHGTVGNLSNAEIDSFVFVCIMPKIRNDECPRIVLSKDDYDIFDNKSVSFAGNLLNFSQYEYENEDSDSIKICVPDWSSVQNVYNETRWALVCGEDLLKMVVVESYLTFALGLISLVFMLTVLITYFLFEKLRNLPGVNTMNLTLSLFLGELVFIASGSAKPHEAWLCSGVGVLLHYLFLTSFFWMNVMAYDVYRTFARKCILTRIRNKKKFMPRYALYAWGSPVLIVAVCAILDFSGIPHVRIGYGGNVHPGNSAATAQTLTANGTFADKADNTKHVYSIGCWIQEPVASMAAFGGPMMLILLGNSIMFTRTIISIRASTKMTHTRVRRSSTSHIAGRDDVMLYIRMSTVMGFTWIFGLASSIVSAFSGPPTKTICIILHLFGIFFIIFNCSQGLFIFFAFVFNRRTLGLYRGLIYRLRNSGGRERPLSASSSRMTLGTSLSQTSVSHIT